MRKGTAGSQKRARLLRRGCGELAIGSLAAVVTTATLLRSELLQAGGWRRRCGGGQGGEGLAGHGESRRCCGAAGRRCLTTVGRDRQGAAKTEESAVQQTRRNATPFPDVSPAARQHPPRQQKGHRRSKANTTEGPQQQKGLRRRCVAAKRGGEGHSNKIDTAKPPPQPQKDHRSRATAAKKMRGRSCMVGLSDLCRKLSGGMGLVLVLLLSSVISEELGLNVTRNRLIVSELHLEGSSA